MRQGRGYHTIDIAKYLPGVTISVPAGTEPVVTFTGEPVCEVVGRAAILIKDENSKVNINVAGGRNFRDTDSAYVQPQGTPNRGPLRRALWSGASTAEYETRVLPQLDTVLTDRTWDLRMGAVTGVGYPSIYGTFNSPPPVPTDFVDPYLLRSTPPPLDGGYGRTVTNLNLPFDASLPGFGRTDDNGNAMWMAMDGVDNDGDGLVDEGFKDLPHYNPATNTIDPPNGVMDPDEAWDFEGIDEPQEYQAYRPLRNRDTFGGNASTFAESDGQDNYPQSIIGQDNADGSADEIGELGDRYLRSGEQLKLVYRIGPATYDTNKNLVTVNGTDLNSRFQHYGTPRTEFYTDPVPKLDAPVLSGPKLDYNYATVEQIFTALQRDWGYYPTPPTGPGNDSPVQNFARGLRREDTAIFGTRLAGTAANAGVRPAFPPDAALRAAQLAANIHDNRDSDNTRTDVTTVLGDQWWSNNVGGYIPLRDISYTQAGVESIRINEIMARPVRRIEAEVNTEATGAPPVPAEPAFYPNSFSAVPNRPDFEVLVQQRDAANNITPVDSTTAPSWSRQGTVLGEKANVTTATLNTVVQFRFAPSPGLPPSQTDPTAVDTPRRVGGRYYLLMNTQRYNPATGRMETTVVGDPLIAPTQTPNFRYVFKYATDAVGQDILSDISAGRAVPWKNTAVVGYRNMTSNATMVSGTETGTVFLPSDPNFDDTALEGYGDNEAYTVHIPPYAADAADQLFLYVAVEFLSPAQVAPAAPALAINYFDFSQEPDHEWIEVVNTATSGKDVNIGGWQLQIGANVMIREDGTAPLGATVLTIPLNTRIAPGGSLLLGFNKYDSGGHDLLGFDTIRPLQTNGIGLTRVLNAAYNMYMTEPPIPGFIPGVAPLPSEFARNSTDFDFNDWNGDGAEDPDDQDDDPVTPFRYDSDGNGTPDTDIADKVVISTPGDTVVPAGPQKPFDRIVELGGAFDAVKDLPSLAVMVLNGGILPNTPEHDGIDNDGDNQALITDGVDNDGDGLVDEQLAPAGDGLNNDNDFDALGLPLIDEYGETNDPVDRRQEGIDEGRWEYTLDGAGLPIGLRNFQPPGSYSDTTIPYVYNNAAGATLPAVTLPYAGAGLNTPPADPPDWKAFAERRWYSPDNVIVILYEGRREDGHVADRVTYSEEDVINRTPDDIVPCPFPHWVDANGDSLQQRSELFTPNSALPSFWPENTMGVDFYRSMERKHPLYNGDLHGLSNRWQATDGSYDDWSPSTSMFERNTGANTITARLINSATGLPDPLYDHAFSGSPLRMSMSQRLMENPNNQFGATAASARRWAYIKAREAFRNRNYDSPGDVATLTNFMDRRIYGDPAVAFDDVPVNYDMDPQETASSFPATVVHADVSVQGVMLAQHPYDNSEPFRLASDSTDDDMAAVVSSAAMDPLVLSAGTANFYTIVPDPFGWNASYAAPADQWDGSTVTNPSPQPWTPVFLFPFWGAEDPTLAGTFRLEVNSKDGLASPFIPSFTLNPLQNFLFRGPYYRVVDPADPLNNTGAFPPQLAAASMAARWPLKLRSVMYASQNIAGFDPNTIDHNTAAAATALFEWDGADGLENGDYDVYLMTAESLLPLSEANSLSGGNYLTAFGQELVNESLDPAKRVRPEDMVFDVEMFTDRNYTNYAGALEPLGPNGRCWIDGSNGNPADNYPQPGEFERTFPVNDYNPQGDSFGMLQSRHPDENGILYYGTVRVENNYLALLLRNWTANGKLARFSRVVLTPHQRTNGRLNINTVETVNASQVFNPLVGTPGMLTTYDPASTVQTYDPPTPLRFSYFREGDISASALPYLQGMRLSNAAVVNRQRYTSELGTIYPIRLHADGRYYGSTSGLVASHPNETPNRDPMNAYSSFLSDLSAVPGTSFGSIFEEEMGRYSRLANLVTTRSDVFEIVVTAQTGYLSSTDLNNDGHIDYRNDFIVTGEKKIRTVYER
jgi:hypothetical protein